MVSVWGSSSMINTTCFGIGERKACVFSLHILGMSVDGDKRAIGLGLWCLLLVAGTSHCLGVEGGRLESVVVIYDGLVNEWLPSTSHGCELFRFAVNANQNSKPASGTTVKDLQGKFWVAVKFLIMCRVLRSPANKPELGEAASLTKLTVATVCWEGVTRMELGWQSNREGASPVSRHIGATRRINSIGDWKPAHADSRTMTKRRT